MTPSATAIEDEIITLETAYWDSMKDDDLQTSLSLTYEPSIVGGAQGVMSIDHAGFRKMSEQKTWKLNDYTIDNMNVLPIGKNVVIVGYGIKLDMEADGQPIKMECAETSTWVKTDDGWKCAQHSESPIGDPFGRPQGAGQSDNKKNAPKP